MPAYNPVIVLEGTGAQVLKLLENGVSKVPGLEGRFPCVSGLRFTFDPKKPPGSRVDPASVVVVKHGQLQSTPIDLAKIYSVSTTEYISKGNDGFVEFESMKVIKDDDATFDITDMIIKVFRELIVGSEFFATPFIKVKSENLIANGLILSAVRRQIVEAHKKLKIKRQVEICEMFGNPDQQTIQEDGKEFYILRPVVDGRIKELK